MLAETAELEAVGRKGIQFRSLLAISTGSLSPNLVRLSLISGREYFLSAVHAGCRSTATGE
jgi:hypothetical protein